MSQPLCIAGLAYFYDNFGKKFSYQQFVSASARNGVANIFPLLPLT
jgi:hypothetical protein